MVLIKNTDNLAALILEFHDVKTPYMVCTTSVIGALIGGFGATAATFHSFLRVSALELV